MLYLYPVEDLIKEFAQEFEIYCSDIVTDVDKAIAIIFPIYYEVMFEYTKEELINYRLSNEQILLARRNFSDAQELANARNKPLVIFHYRDTSITEFYSNVLFFRTSLYKSKSFKYEFALPAFINDPLIEKELLFGSRELVLVDKAEFPLVGFRGQSAPIHLDFKSSIKYGFNRFTESVLGSSYFKVYYNNGYLKRRDAIIQLNSNKNVRTDISITNWGMLKEDSFSYRKQYFLNMERCPYQLCVSGFGNYSFRFYETLAMGRIPLFIDTDCVLPYEEMIEWSNHGLFIHEKQIKKISQLLLEFHSSMDNDKFKQLQQNNRTLYENYLTKKSFYKNLNNSIQYFISRSVK